MNNTEEIYIEKLEKIQKRISPEHHANTLKRAEHTILQRKLFGK